MAKGKEEKKETREEKATSIECEIPRMVSSS